MNKKGIAGEAVAEQYFKQLGYQLLQKNYQNKLGEIDLIFRHFNILVFVEVKARSSECEWMGLGCVNERKKRNLRKMIYCFLASLKSADWVDETRLDIVFVTQERVASHIEGEFL